MNTDAMIDQRPWSLSLATWHRRFKRITLKGLGYEPFISDNMHFQYYILASLPTYSKHPTYGDSQNLSTLSFFL
jgi:hypothetical protein